MNEPHLERLRNARAFGVGQSAAHHHRKNHRCGGANSILGVLLQLPCDVQHSGKIRHYVTLRQARAKEQQAGQRAVFHEQFFSAINLCVIGPWR